MSQNIYDYPSGNDLSKILSKIKKPLSMIGILIVALILFFGSFYTIKEQEEAILVTFGKAKAVSTAGLHFKVPIMQKVIKVDTTIQGFYIGFDPNTNLTIEDEAIMITNDFNFVNVDFFVEYRVSDPIKAIYASLDPVIILKNVAQSSIRAVVGSKDVDSVITDGKHEIQSIIKDAIMEKMQQQDIGIQLVNISIQDSEPPTEEVMEAFKSVETAKQGKETALNNAEKYSNEKLPEAEAEVDKILQEAQSTKTQRINEAYAEIAKFNEMYEEYIKYPLITKERMFYEAMEDVLPSLKVIIDNGNGDVQKLLPLDSLMEGGN